MPDTSAVDLAPQPLTLPVSSVIDDAHALTITSPEARVTAGELLKAIRGFVRQIEEYHAPRKAKAREVWKAWCDQEAQQLGPLKDADARLVAGMRTYDEAEERKRREEEARLQAEAKRLEEERALAEAAHLAELGDKAQANAVLEEALTAPMPVVSVASSVPKVQGLSGRETWKGRVTNLRLLIRAAAENPQFQPLLQPNAAAINALARALKQNGRVPGVEFYAEKSYATRG